MRILVWFTIGFTAAIALGVYCLGGSFLLLLALFAAAAGAALLFLRDKLCKIAAIILLGFFVGSFWMWGYDTLYMKTMRQFDGQSISTTVTVTDYSYDTQYGVAADGNIYLDGKRYSTRVYVSDSEPLNPGDQIVGEMKLRMTTKDSLEGETYHQGKGIYLLIYADKDAQLIRADEVNWRYYPAILRRHITDLIDTYFAADTYAFARALLLGDSSQLTYEEDTAFKISGIRHVIAVSGLHISILFSMILFLSGQKRVSVAVIGLPVLFLFSAVAGFTPSVVRACIMQALVILAITFDREYDPPIALAFAVLTMLAARPLTITSVSFQLSVGCIIGIFLFYQRLYDFFVARITRFKKHKILTRSLHWLAASVSITISAMSVTTPLSALYFGTVSLAGIFTNLLTLWVISFIFYGIVAVCVLGLFWSWGAKTLAWVVCWPIRYIQKMAEFMSGSTISAVYTCSVYVVMWLIFTYVLITIFFLSRRKHPHILAAGIALGLCLALGASWLEPRLDNYRFTALDVGQGQCVVWQCDGMNYMVDCGGDTPEGAADQAASYLLSQGVTRLDGLILTHYDTDHAAGVIPLLSRIDVDTLYLPDIPDDSNYKELLTQKYADRILWVRESLSLNEGKSNVSLYPSTNDETNNESCLCVLFQTEKCAILITGDRSMAGERELLRTGQIPDIDVLVIGHHGSKHSTCLELLHETRPEVAVISVSAENTYGHPAQEVLDRLKLYGCNIWRTDLDKTIIIRG